MRIEINNAEAVVKEALWLAWKACGGPQGMGVFQDHPTATREEVWTQAYNRGDYPSGNSTGINRPGKVHADYVFGRMMKLGFQWGDDWVEFYDVTPRPDYQAWCHKYPTTQALVEAAITNLTQKPLE